jgi:DNA invertase Pin-like site-specific DNA recombinase
MKTKEKASPVRAAVYARKSSEDARNPGKSVSDQVREATAEAAMRGYELSQAHVFADLQASASRHAKNKPRPQYAALLSVIAAGEVDTVVMAEQSRASRRMSVMGALVELCADHGVKLVLGGRDVDPTNPSDLVLLGVQSGMDAAESERTSERCLRGARGLALAGLPAGKNLYGYARIYDVTTRTLIAVEVVPDEAFIIREIVDRILLGDPLNEIAADLNTRGVPSPYDAVAARCNREPLGATWVGTQVRRVALSPAYAGLRVHRGKLTKAVWPAIVTAREHERLQAIIKNPSRRTNAGVRPGAIVHWLSGVATCGECGSGMRVLTNRKKYRYYTCQNCMKVARTANGVEALVEQYIFAIVRRPDTLSAIAAASESFDGQGLVSRLDELTARRDNVRDLIVTGALPAEDGAAMLLTLAGDIESAERALREMTLPRNVADVVSSDLPERWHTFTPARKREIAAALVDVKVLSMHGRKSRVFDPESVQVNPKGGAR